MTTTDKGTFIPTENYERVVPALADLLAKPNPFSEGSTAARLWIENEIKLVLGTIGDLWPAEIYGSLVIDALEHADRQHAI